MLARTDPLFSPNELVFRRRVWRSLVRSTRPVERDRIGTPNGVRVFAARPNIPDPTVLYQTWKVFEAPSTIARVKH